MLEPQSNLKVNDRPNKWNDDFSSKTALSIFMSMTPELDDRSKENSWVFPALKKTSHLFPHSTVSLRSDSRSEDNFNLLPHIRCLVTARV